MPQTKILKNINLLNILLIVAILIFVNYTILPLFHMSVHYTPPSGKIASVHEEEKAEKSEVPSLTDYTMIADENLFHPERRIPAETTQAQPLEQPEFVLYGTMITDDVCLAYLEDLKAPHSTQGRGKRHSVVKIGDNMSGFTLKEIYADKVIMSRGGETMVIELIADKKTRKTKTTAKRQRLPASRMQQKLPTSAMPKPQRNIPIKSRYDTTRSKQFLP